jgi:anaerobic ribonucleoside-triphosphate reductase
MDGVWLKHCPMCGEYVRKSDPEETAKCPSCGWREYVAPYYCEFRRRFCSQEDENIACFPVQHSRSR